MLWSLSRHRFLKIPSKCALKRASQLHQTRFLQGKNWLNGNDFIPITNNSWINDYVNIVHYLCWSAVHQILLHHKVHSLCSMCWMSDQNWPPKLFMMSLLVPVGLLLKHEIFRENFWKNNFGSQRENSLMVSDFHHSAQWGSNIQLEEQEDKHIFEWKRTLNPFGLIPSPPNKCWLQRDAKKGKQIY